MSKKAKSKVVKAKRQPSGYIWVEDRPAWLEWIVPERFNDTKLDKYY